jgi:Aspartyl/Asparaginyl beta-hydroxylase
MTRRSPRPCTNMTIRRSMSGSTTTAAPPPLCDIVQGPSLLRTTATHRPRPSLLFLPGLRSLPFWTKWDAAEGVNCVAYQDPTVVKAVSLLQDNFYLIQSEYFEAAHLPSDYQADTEHRLHRGTWDWTSYMTKGSVRTLSSPFLQHFPQTVVVLQQLRDANLLFEGTPFGYCFVSTLHGRSSIDAHAAPTNLRLRVHLPLVVPPDNSTDQTSSCGIRVGSISRSWRTGQALVLDDSYDHEVWNDTQEKRVVLLVDLWHPDIRLEERREIVSLFQHAQKQGWWSAASE